MANMIKPLTAKLVVLGLAILAIVSGLGMFNDWVNNAMAGSVLTVIFGTALMTEVGLKKFTNLSKLKNLDGIAMISLFLGLFLFGIGVLSLLGVTFASLAGVQGFFLIAGGAFIGVQAFV